MIKQYPNLFIDTNILHGDYFFHGINIKKLLLYKEFTNANIYIPQIVVDELTKQYNDISFNTLEGIKRIIPDKVDDLYDKDYDRELSIAKIEQLRFGYPNFIHQKLQDLGFIILPYPENRFKQFINSLINKIKPFHHNDKQETKDCLIRLTYLNLEEDISNTIFISENIQEFKQNKENSFKNELLQDVRDLGVVNFYGKDKYYNNIHTLRDDYISVNDDPRINMTDDCFYNIQQYITEYGTRYLEENHYFFKQEDFKLSLGNIIKNNIKKVENKFIKVEISIGFKINLTDNLGQNYIIHGDLETYFNINNYTSSINREKEFNNIDDDYKKGNNNLNFNFVQE